MTRMEKRYVQTGSIRYQYEIPFSSSQRSEKAHMSAAATHTPTD
jgi:hypothetical protein